MVSHHFPIHSNKLWFHVNNEITLISAKFSVTLYNQHTSCKTVARSKFWWWLEFFFAPTARSRFRQLKSHCDEISERVSYDSPDRPTREPSKACDRRKIVGRCGRGCVSQSGTRWYQLLYHSFALSFSATYSCTRLSTVDDRDFPCPERTSRPRHVTSRLHPHVLASFLEFVRKPIFSVVPPSPTSSQCPPSSSKYWTL